MKLDTQPSQNLTVTITDPADNTDVTASPATLTFTTVNWSTAQTVAVTAAQDDEADDETATVTHAVASTDATCNAVTAGDVAVSVDADETAAITLSKSTLEIEEGETDGTTYTVKLRRQADRRSDGHHLRPGRHGPHPELQHADLHHQRLGYRPDRDGNGGRRRGRDGRHGGNGKAGVPHVHQFKLGHEADRDDQRGPGRRGRRRGRHGHPFSRLHGRRLQRHRHG